MIASIALSLTAAAGSAPAQAGHAVLHPETPELYVELTSVPRLRDALYSSALVRVHRALLADERILEVARQLTGDADLQASDLDAWTRQGLDELTRAEPELMGVLVDLRAASLSLSGLRWDRDLLRERMHELEEGATGERLARRKLEVLASRIGLTACLEFDTPAVAQRVLGELVGELRRSGVTAEPAGEPAGALEGEVDGESLRLDLGGGVGAWLARRGGRIVLGAGGASLEDFAARTSFSSLAANPHLAAGLAAVASDERHPLLRAHVAPPYRELGEWLSCAMGLSRELDDLPHVPALVREFGDELLAGCLGGLAAATYELSFDGERFRTTGFEELLPGAEAVRIDHAGAVARIPDDAVAVWATPLDASALWTAAKLALGPESAHELGRLARGEEGDGGVDVEAGLFENLGPRMLLTVSPVSGLVPPKIKLWCEARDPSALEGALEALVERLEPLLPPQVVFERQEYRDRAYFRLDVGLRLYLVSLQPTFTVLDDRLFVALDPLLVKREIRARAKGDAGTETTGSHPHFQGEEHPLLTSSSYLFIDWPAILGGYYEAARTLAGTLAPNFGVNLTAEDLPDASVFTGHLSPTVSSSRPVEGGRRVENENPFGPTSWLVAGGLAAGLVVPMFTDRPVVARREVAELEIRNIQDALQEYAVLHMGVFPDSLEELTRPTERGHAILEAVPVDPWGREYRYEPPPAASTRTRVYSLGRDGEVGGEGEDADIGLGSV